MFKSFRKIFLLNFLVLFIVFVLYSQLTSTFLQKDFFYLSILLFCASLIISFLITKIIVIPKELDLINLQEEFEKSNDEIKIKNHQKNFELELVTSAMQEKLKEQRELSEVLEEKLNVEIKSKEEKEQLLKEQLKLVIVGKVSINVIDLTNDIIFTIKGISSNLTDINTVQLNKTLENIENINKKLKNLIFPNEDKNEFYIDKLIMETIRKFDDIFISHNIKVDYSISKSILYYGIQSEFVQVVMNIFENIIDSLIKKNNASKKIFVRIKKDKQFVFITISDNAERNIESNMNYLFEPNIIQQNLDLLELELIITKVIIEENMHGKFEYENTNQSKKFTVKIPILEDK